MTDLVFTIQLQLMGYACKLSSLFFIFFLFSQYDKYRINKTSFIAFGTYKSLSA